MKFVKYSMCLLMLMSVPSALFSQTNEWIVDKMSDSTLLTNQVMAIAVDSNSNKWIATYGGGGGVNELSYDWKTWTHYVFGSVYSLAVDTDNVIWVGTGGAGLMKFYNGTWTTYTPSNCPLPGYYILSMTVDRNNNKWIGTDKGLAELNGTKWIVLTTQNGLPSDYINSNAIDKKGQVWVGTSDGLSVYDGTNWITDTTGNSGLPDNFVWAVAIDDSGNVWAGTRKGLTKYDGTHWSTYLNGDNVRALAADDTGNIWAGIYGGGVQHYDGHNWTSYTTSNSGLPDSLINAITIDALGNKWIGTDGGGLAVYRAGGVDQAFAPPPNPPPNPGSLVLDKRYVITSESKYISSCVTSSGSIIMSPNFLYTFQGSPHYKISPYFSNFAAIGLLDDSTTSNIAIVKNWMTWVFSHLNSDGSIYDYYVDSLVGGTDLPSIDAFTGENIPDYDSKDSYAATFLTLARKYIEVVPSDTTWLKGYSEQLRSIGNALYSTIDDSTHYFNQFSPDNNDGLSVAKPDYQVKYTMDNSEVNEGLRDMVWLEQNVVVNGNPSFYQQLLNENTKGFSNLWDSRSSAYYPYEGSSSVNWRTFYPDATCQLWPILCGVISPTSAQAKELYSTFNSFYSKWQTGTYYGSYPWSVVSYVAALMDDTARVDAYLRFVQSMAEQDLNPANWYVSEAAFTLRAAKGASSLTALREKTQVVPLSFVLQQNYPNPFNPSTIIGYQVPMISHVVLKVYDVLGREVKTLTDKVQQPGSYDVTFDAAGLPSGVYFCQLSARGGSLSGQTGSYSQTRKMMVLK